MHGNYKLPAVALIVILSGFFLWSVHFYTRGSLSLPLDDSFIYFQFAKNIVTGGIPEWSPGDGFSSAATSPLYPFILAIGYAAGLRGEWIMIWAFLIGLGCFIASFFLLAALSRKLLPAGSHRLYALLAPCFFVLSGSQAWGYLSGMETGLFSTALLAALYYAIRYMEEQGNKKNKVAWTLAAWGAFLSILRPEGFFLVLMLAGLLVLREFAEGGKKRAIASLPWFLMAAPALAWLAVIYAFTGQCSPTSMQQKSYFYDPSVTPYLLFAFTFQNVKRVLDNVYLRGQSPPFFVIFFFIGLFPLLVKEIKKRLPAEITLITLWFLLGSLSTMISLTSDKQHFRYQMPFFNLYLLCGSVGIIAALASAGEKLKVWAGGILCFFLFIQVVNLPRWIDTYGMNSKNIFDQQIAMGKYIEKNLPKDAIIGLNDAGAIPYFSGRRAFDILGMGTEGQACRYRHGTGSVFEGFENMEKQTLPDYFALYPRWWFNPDILKERIFDITLTDNTICGDSYKALYKSDWSLLGTGRYPAVDHGKNLEPVDWIDVADLKNEKLHGYLGPAGTTFTAMTYSKSAGAGGGQENKVADGGRRIQCGKAEERMTINLSDLKATKMIARLRNNSSPLQLLIRINDRVAGKWRLPSLKSWQEPEIDIPGEFFTAGENRVRIECSGDGAYHSYHYWFMQ